MLNKIKDILNKKINYKHFLGTGIILFICGFLIYFKSQELSYMNLSAIGIIIATLAVVTHCIKNHKQDFKYAVFGSVLVLFVFLGIGMFAKQMYKSTNISIEAWVNSISVMLASLIGAGISGAISYFLVSKQMKISSETVKKQIKSSNEALEKQIEENKQLTTYSLEESKKETNERNNNVALNYVYLLNTEMAIHRDIFITYIYYKVHHKPVEKDLDDIFKSLNSEKWDKLFVECAKCFSNKLMKELSAYYYGIELLKQLELNDTQKKDIIEGQLISMYSCISIAESDFNEKLRVKYIYDFGGRKVSVDKKTGKLIIK